MNQTGMKETWGTRLGVILAVTGSAVGLGNFLRFPGLAAKYDGGAFMIPYFVAFLLLGLPIAWSEWAMGRYGGRHGYNSSPAIFRVLWRNRAAPYFGVLAMVVPVMIYMYYVYIEAWCLAYAVRYLFGAMGFENPQQFREFFAKFTGIEQDGAAWAIEGQGLLGSGVFFLVLCFVLNFVLIYRGLNKGIEWFCSWAMPALLVCAVIVLVRVLTLGTPDPQQPDLNVLNGLGYMWNPTTERLGFFESLRKPEMWMEAAGQIFFSLSVGFGIIITYASYLKSDDDIALSGLTACSGNEFCEVALGGLMIVPAAYVFFGHETLQASQSTFALGFVTLPNVFGKLPAGGDVIGFLFFFLLFLAAVTSSLSMLQPAIALLEEGLGLRRRASVAMLGFITAVGSVFIVYFSKDLTALDTIDFWVGTFGIYVLALFQVILFGWVLGVDRGFEELDRGAEIRVPRVFKFIIKYVSPTYLLAVFLAWAYQSLFVVPEGEPSRLQAIVENRTVQLSVGMIVLVSALFALLIAQSVQRWRAAERAAGGKKP